MTLFARDVRSAANEDWSRLVAVLFGLTMPIAVMTVLDPRRLIDDPSIFEVCMIGVCLACFFAYAASVLFPGQVMHVWLDQESGELELVCRGICSSAINAIPLPAIAAVECAGASIYLRLKNGRSIRLPASMTKGEIEAITAALSCVNGTAALRAKRD